MSRELRSRSAALHVPRYVCAARLLEHQASHALGNPADQAAVERDLGAMDRVAAIESRWWAGDLAIALGAGRWLDRAADRAARLARFAGPRSAGLQWAAELRLRQWQAALSRSR